MRIRWTVPAAADLESIKSYLEKNSSNLAEPTVRRIYDRIRAQMRGPFAEGEEEAQAIEILHIYHGAQDWK